MMRSNMVQMVAAGVISGVIVFMVTKKLQRQAPRSSAPGQLA